VVGLINIQAGDDPSETGFDRGIHGPRQTASTSTVRPALEVGTANEPIRAGHSAEIRLGIVPELDPDESPAIVCCGGRWDTLGQELRRSWVKLGALAYRGATTLTLAEPVADWRVGDRVIITATRRPIARAENTPATARASHQTEERLIKAVDGRRLTINEPLEFAHYYSSRYSGEVANLSPNVVIESADPTGVRGRTMYHRHSTGSRRYVRAENNFGSRGLLHSLRPPVAKTQSNECHAVNTVQNVT
jgi:hypothetical protein